MLWIFFQKLKLNWHYRITLVERAIDAICKSALQGKLEMEKFLSMSYNK